MDNRYQSRNILKNVGYALLAEGKTIRIKAHGYSMYPAIRPGSVLVIEPISIKGDPVPGEIIAIKRESGLIVHRLSKIVEKEGIEYFVARGDSNAWPDNPVKIHMIAGRVVSAEKGTASGTPDVRINRHPGHFLNRIRVIAIILKKKILR